jgi:D-alanyl-lipoteichoic acid acyltransferase DltB (MBOAT superfamily)
MPLSSWSFVLLASTAIVTLPVARGAVRTALFVLLNSVFVWTYWGAAAAPQAVGFLLLGYVAARVVAGRGTAALAVALILLTALFAYLRGYAADFIDLSRSNAAGLVAIAGLSFLFFKMAHVVIDASGGAIGPLSFTRYLNYCLNFTTLLMGPIQRFQDFAAQWNDPAASRQLDIESGIDAANRALRGALKAFVLAPYLAPYVMQPGMPLDSLTAGELLVRVYAFYVFLYLDFSGYCDIMIGIGSLMGIRPPENFNFPFLARNVSEYWLRVHRTLTEWLTDYIFTPSYKAALEARVLARHGFVALAASLLLTMVVAGLWHGATANFLLFGLIHGAALVVTRGYEWTMTGWLGRGRFLQLRENPVVTVAAVLLTYNFTSLAYVFFALDAHEGSQVFARLSTLAGTWP